MPKRKSTLFSNYSCIIIHRHVQIKIYYVLWTVSMCTTSLHSKLCRIVLWYECTRMIWMNCLFTNYFALVAIPGLISSFERLRLVRYGGSFSNSCHISKFSSLRSIINKSLLCCNQILPHSIRPPSKVLGLNNLSTCAPPNEGLFASELVFLESLSSF
jgi:hypothetical protein